VSADDDRDDDLFARVLLATEGTEFDAGAERLAIALAARVADRRAQSAARAAGDVAALAAVLPVASNAEFEAIAPGAAAQADAQVHAARERLQAQASVAGVVLTVGVRHGGDADREIVEEAIERRASLLVIRRRGRQSFIARLLVGSMVSRVVERAPCPVLLVPRSGELWQGRVLVALDPREPEAARDRLCASARAAAALTGAEVAEVSIGSGADPAPARVAEQIIEAAVAQRAGLVVIGRAAQKSHHGRLGSTARKIIGLFEGPVLVDTGGGARSDQHRHRRLGHAVITPVSKPS
jgi:nucleotide-binding universal stress UspA family protein